MDVLSTLCPLAIAMLLTGALMVALLVAIKMVLPLQDVSIRQDVPRSALGGWVPLGIGALSSMMGIGGGRSVCRR